mgnify:CR=1 FL=1
MGGEGPRENRGWRWVAVAICELSSSGSAGDEYLYRKAVSVTIHQSIPLNDLKKLNTSDTFRYLHHRIGPWIFVYLSLFGALSQVWTTIINGRAIKTTPEQSSLQEEEEPDVLRL